MFLSTLVGDPETASEFLRIKGVLNIQGSDNMFVLQCVHMLKNQNFTYEWDPDQPRENRIIFIGRGMEARRHVLTEDMMSCVAKPLRFKVGDAVLASYTEGKFVPGTIIRQWDDFNAYRIQLEDG